MFIVIFNFEERDSEILKTNHGFIQEFADQDDAVDEAQKWLDGKDYRTFKVFEEDWRKIF